MLPLLVLAATAAQCGLAAQTIQGIFIANRQVSTDFISPEHLRPGKELEDYLAECAAKAVDVSSTAFYLVTPDTPPVNGDDRVFCYPKLHQARFSNLAKVAPTIRTAICIDPANRCRDIAAWKFLPTGQEAELQPLLGHDTLNMVKEMSFEACKLAVLEHNTHSARPYTYVRYRALTGSAISTKCEAFGPGALKAGGQIKQTNTYLGLLAAPKYKENGIEVARSSSIANLGCTARDIVQTDFKECNTFSYTVADNFQISTRTSMPENALGVPLSNRVVEITRLGGRYTFEYHLQGHAKHAVFSPNIDGAGRYPKKTTTLKAFDAAEAVRECSKAALSHYYRTFNLVLRPTGWQCTQIFPMVHNDTVNLLDTEDASATMSWWYTANLDSANSTEPQGQSIEFCQAESSGCSIM